MVDVVGPPADRAKVREDVPDVVLGGRDGAGAMNGGHGATLRGVCGRQPFGDRVVIIVGVPARYVLVVEAADGGDVRAGDGRQTGPAFRSGAGITELLDYAVVLLRSTRPRGPGMDAGIDRFSGDNAKRCCQREVVSQRFDPGRADDGGQCEGGLQHGEVVTDA